MKVFAAFALIGLVCGIENNEHLASHQQSNTGFLTNSKSYSNIHSESSFLPSSNVIDSHEDELFYPHNDQKSKIDPRRGNLINDVIGALKREQNRKENLLIQRTPVVAKLLKNN